MPREEEPMGAPPLAETSTHAIDPLLEVDDHHSADGGDDADTDAVAGAGAGAVAARQMSPTAFAVAFSAMCMFYFTYARAEHSYHRAIGLPHTPSQRWADATQTAQWRRAPAGVL